MDKFSIDEVAEIFSSDVNTRLDQLESVGRSLRTTILNADDQENFTSIENICHSVYGTSALLSIESLASTSKFMERLACIGQRRTDLIKSELAELDMMIGICMDGAAVLRKMLALELAHKSDEALVELNEFNRRSARFQALVKEQPAVLSGSLIPAVFTPEHPDSTSAETVQCVEQSIPAPVKSEDAFSFSGEQEAKETPAAEEAFIFESEPQPEAVPKEPEPESFSFEVPAIESRVAASNEPPIRQVCSDVIQKKIEHDSVDAELLDVFKCELEGLVPELKHNLNALAEKYDVSSAIQNLERIYHTIKGAAASVGLTGISSSVSNLETIAENSQDGIPRHVVKQMVAETNECLVICGFDPIVLTVEPMAAEESFIFEQSSSNISTPPTASSPETPPEGAEAASFGFEAEQQTEAVSVESTETVGAADSNSPDEFFSFGEELNVATPPEVHLAVRSNPPAEESNGQSVIDSEMLEVFKCELEGLLPELTQCLHSVASNGADKEATSNLARIYHTIKGASSSVGHRETSARSAKLEDILESPEVVENGIPKELISRLLEDTNWFLESSGIAKIELPAGPVSPPVIPSIPSVQTQTNATANIAPSESMQPEHVVQIAAPKIVNTPGGDSASQNQTVAAAVITGVVELLPTVDQMPEVQPVSNEPHLDHVATPVDEKAESFIFKQAEDAMTAPEAVVSIEPPLAPAGTVIINSGEPVPAMSAAPVELQVVTVSADEPRNEPATPLAPEVFNGGDSDPELLDIFKSELQELLPEIQKSLRALVQNPNDRVAIETLARVYHTIKGASASVGLTGISSKTAHLETLFESIIESGLAPEALTLSVADTNLCLVFCGFNPINLSLNAQPAQLLQGEPGKSLTSEDSAASMGQTEEDFSFAEDSSANPAEETASDSDTPTDREDAVQAVVPVSANPAVPAATEPGEEQAAECFSFEQTTDAESSATASAAHGPNLGLLEVYGDKARDVLAPALDYLNELQANPLDEIAARKLGLIYHAIRSSAVAIGLTVVSNIAASLESTVERSIADARGFSSDMLLLLREKTVVLKQSCGGVEPSNAAEKGPMSDELARIFHSEAARLLVQADERLMRLNEGPAAESERAELAAIFHHLKGSAVLFPMRQVAEEAARLQETVITVQPLDALVLALQNGIASIRKMIRIEAPSAVTSVIPSTSFVPRLTSAQAVQSRIAPSSTLSAPAVTAPKYTAPSSSYGEAEIQADPELWEAFTIETGELLEEVDRLLVKLEDSDQPKIELGHLFRAYHTLKGAFYTAGVNSVGNAVHKVETMLEDMIAAMVLPPPKRIATFLLSMQSELRARMRRDGEKKEFDLAWVDSGIASLKTGGNVQASVVEKTSESKDSASDSSVGAAVASDSSKGISSATKISKGDGVKDSDERAGERHIRVSRERLDGLMNLAGEMVVSRSRMMRRTLALRTLQNDLSLSRNRLLHTVDGFRERYEFSLMDARRNWPKTFVDSSTMMNFKGGEGSRTVSPVGQIFTELELDRYDDINILARSLGEICSDVSELQVQLGTALDNFTEDTDVFNTIVTGLQTQITRTRMVTLQQIFMRLRLSVRDAADREGKEVRVITEGEDVSLDKAVIDELYVPLQHLVRNSVSHGIESAGVRTEAGKSAEGIVTIAARQESGQIILTVSDDGKGLDLQRLYELGVSRKLIPAEMRYDDPAVAELIFVSGVSTKNEATDVAGRGVGCDVVRVELEKLNGQIRVESIAGEGTAFTISLPLTLAISRALMVCENRRAYAIPINFVKGVFDITDARIVDIAGGRRVEHAGDFIKLVSLRDVLEPGAQAVRPPKKKHGNYVLLEVGKETIALEVDELIGQEEVVVKNLGPLLQGHRLFSGATPSAEGALILILDVPGVVDSIRKKPSEISRSQASLPQYAPEEPERSRVLVVDDSLSVRKVAEKFLRALGVNVTVAVDGQDAMAKLRETHFDVVFTDLEMPNMNGYELIREMRYVPAFKEIPVVVVTSRAGSKHRDRAVALGANGYVTKPFTQEILSQKLNEFLGARKNVES